MFISNNIPIYIYRYLIKAYNSLIPSVYGEYLNNSNQIVENFVRYVFYLTEKNELFAKEIHYYKNVKSLYHHYAMEVDVDSWKFTPSPYNGHYLAHYRKNVAEIVRSNWSGSIRKLNIDFQYLFFLLKKFTKFCNE